MAHEPSPFNILLPSPLGAGHVLVNSYSRTLTELSSADAEALRSGGPFSAEPVAQGLREIGALTDAPERQRDAVYRAFEREQANTRDLVLVVPLTARCNMQCTYCYQVIHGDFQGAAAADVGEWTAERVEALGRFVRGQLAAEAYEAVQVRWYGGEPLLRLDLIETIGGRIAEETAAAGRRLHGMAVTNGVRLTAPAIATLRRFAVERLEISLDGPRETHDRLRPLRTGRSSYETVLAAIARAAEAFAEVVFRVNVHAANAEAIVPWLEEVAPRARRPNVFLKFKLVEGDRSNTLDYPAFAALTLRYRLACRRLGLGVLQGALATETCPAIRKNYYIVQPDLRVYKCPQNLGSGDHVGVLTPDGALAPTWRLAHWTGFHVSRSAGCDTCAHLPHCNGGCPYNEVMAGINAEALDVYRRQERCCGEKHVPELLLARLL
ncbi:MAG TPA: radical SAM protein [Methylomirabilota bacterium]|nr:radical SAM protein [Methylomirabilota bacterium]